MGDDGRFKQMCKHGMIDGMHVINNSGCYIHWWLRSVSPLTIITKPGVVEAWRSNQIGMATNLNRKPILCPARTSTNANVRSVKSFNTAEPAQMKEQHPIRTLCSLANFNTLPATFAIMQPEPGSLWMVFSESENVQSNSYTQVRFWIWTERIALSFAANDRNNL